MNSVGPHSDDPIPEQHSSNSVTTPPTHTSEASSSQHHTKNPEPASALAKNVPVTRTIRQRKRPSQKRIEANRRNARLSTGPRSPRGKLVVSKNAIKHGLLARHVVVLDDCAGEKKEDFETLLSQLWEHHIPLGAMEEILVEKIAVLLWRHARVLRAENGEIRKRVSSAKSDVLSELLANTNDYPDNTMVQSPLENECVRASAAATVLHHVKRELTEIGHISKPLREALVASIGYVQSPLVTACLTMESKVKEHEGCEKAPAKVLEPETADIIKAIDIELAVLETSKQLASDDRQLRVESEILSRSLPPDGAIEKILRYDAHIERQLYRAIHELERLQRRRMGEAVPPPLAVRFN